MQGPTRLAVIARALPRETPLLRDREWLTFTDVHSSKERLRQTQVSMGKLEGR